jgi:hypothetical protein
MIYNKNNLYAIVFSIFVSAFALASETSGNKVEIKAYSSEITIGEPLILEISISSLAPAINPKTGEIPVKGEIPAPYLWVTKKGQKEEIRQDLTLAGRPLNVFDYKKKGLEYIGWVLVFYNEAKKGLLFNELGTYNCRLENTRYKIESNAIEINVKPASSQEQKALSILTGELDLAILGADGEVSLDTKETSGCKERFQQVVEQCPDTMLAKMAAFHVGTKLADESETQRHEQNPNLPSAEHLRNEAAKYFEMVLKLPDAFSIREKILYGLSEKEYHDKNYAKAISYLQELSDKYPYGEHAKSALSGIEEIKRDMAKDPNWANRINNIQKTQGIKPIGVVLPAAVGLAVVVLAAGGILLYKKKSKPNQP